MMNGQETQSPENIFKQKIMNLCYDYIRATYPSLMPYIITLKLDNIDLEEGKASAVIILKRSNDVAYIPIVISGSVVLSCEMVYYKNDDRFFPLINKEVSKLVNLNETQPATLIKSPRVQSTFNFFRNMYRPPITERIALASDISDLVAGLPNEYKKAIKDTIKSSKEILKKVAEFYPIDELLSKLEPSNNWEDKLELPKIASSDDINTVITMDDINDTSYKYISKANINNITNRGYDLLAKVAYDKDVVLEKDIVKNTVLSHGIKEIIISDYKKGFTGDVFVIVDGQLKLLNNAIVAGTHIYHGEDIYDMVTPMEWCDVNNSSRNLTMVVRNISEGIDPTLFVAYGGRYAIPFFNNLKDKVKDTPMVSVGIFIPNKKGRYLHLTDAPTHKDNPLDIPVRLDKLQIMEDDVDDTYTVNINTQDIGTKVWTINIVDSLTTSGFRKDKVVYVPSKSLCVVEPSENKKAHVIGLSGLIEYIKKQLPKYTLLSDTKQYHVKKDGVLLGTFNKEASVANYIHTTLDVEPSSIYNLIDNVKTGSLSNNNIDFYVMEKNAAAFDLSNGAQQGIVQQNLGLQSMSPDTMAYKPNGGAPNLAGKGLPPVVDSNTLTTFAGGMDKTIMDIGILSSIYNNDDIKVYLLDYIPHFTETISNLGKVILLFNLNKDKLVNSYGSGEYASIMSTLRKIFKSLAEIVIDLEKYTNISSAIGSNTLPNKSTDKRSGLFSSNNRPMQLSSI